MENTSCGCDCPFVKQGFCATEKECPHYVESWWTLQDSKENKLVKDCSPKRLLLDSQIAYNRMIGLQGAVEKMEFTLSKLEKLLEGLITQSQKFISDKNNLKIEVKE